MKNSIPLLYIIGLLFISACNSNHKFDSSKWKEKKVDWEMSDFRENMLEDLITSKILIGMKLEGVINLLGQAESVIDGELIYLVREKYDTDIDPQYISMLKIEFDKNSQVKKCKLIEK